MRPTGGQREQRNSVNTSRHLDSLPGNPNLGGTRQLFSYPNSDIFHMGTLYNRVPVSDVTVIHTDVPCRQYLQKQWHLDAWQPGACTLASSSAADATDAAACADASSEVLLDCSICRGSHRTHTQIACFGIKQTDLNLL